MPVIDSFVRWAGGKICIILYLTNLVERESILIIIMSLFLVEPQYFFHWNIKKIISFRYK